MTTSQPTALERAMPFIRLPDSPDREPELAADGQGLRCPVTGRTFLLRDGVLDLLAADFDPTPAQRALDTGWTARLYDWGRPHLPGLLGMPSIAEEEAAIAERLALAPGDAVLDIACGQGNFTAAIAAQVGESGLVVGVDIASAMLARAAEHVRELRLDNVLLVRADGLRLPIATGAFRRVNCSGGMHQFPDTTLALAEMGRVSAEGARVTVSGFAASRNDPFTRFKRWTERRFEAHFVPIDEMRRDLAAAGYEEIHAAMAGRWMGYGWAQRAAKTPIASALSPGSPSA